MDGVTGCLFSIFQFVMIRRCLCFGLSPLAVAADDCAATGEESEAAEGEGAGFGDGDRELNVVDIARAIVIS